MNLWLLPRFCNDESPGNFFPPLLQRIIGNHTNGLNSETREHSEHTKTFSTAQFSETEYYNRNVNS